MSSHSSTQTSSSAQATAYPPPRRVAILGGGNIARAHLRALRDPAVAARTPVEVVAVADQEADRAAEFAQENEIAASYDDLARLLEEAKPDLVHLCTPPGGHAEQAITCLRADTSVLCEKPPCLSLAEYDAILAAERSSRGVFSVVFQHRFGAAAHHVSRLLSDGLLGRPFVGLCVTAWFRDHAYYAVPWRGRWDTEGGGPTLGHGIHQMDLLGHLLGDWEEVQAVAECLDRPVETEDVSLATIRFANGALASVVNSVLSPREESYIRLDCERATVELKHLYGYRQQNWTITPPPGSEDNVPEAWTFPTPDVPSSHTAQIAELLDDLEHGRQPVASGGSARRTMELVTAIYCSAQTGRPVRRDDLTEDNRFYHGLGGRQ